MKSERTRSIPSQVILGAFVVGLGILFLLDNLDIVDFHRALAFWPAAFILFGVVKLLDTNSPKGVLVGSALIGVGLVMTINRLGFMHINMRVLWPLVIIFIGGAVIYRAVTGRRLIGMRTRDVEASDNVVDITAILGTVERRITTPDFRGGEVTAIMGGCMLDLRGSSIAGEAVVNVFALMGGITFKVPPDWSVVLNGTPIMGGFDEKTIAAPNSNKRLVIKGYAIMGGVEVRN